MTGGLRALFHAGSAALLCGALIVSGVVERAETPIRDLLTRLLPSRPASGTAVVMVDEESLRKVGAWPWDRERLAVLVTRIREAGARGLAVDLLLPEPRPGDVALADALRSLPSVLAVARDAPGWIIPAPALGGLPRAHINFEVEGDGVVRSLLSTKQDEEISYPALALAAARLVDPRIAIPVARPLLPEFRVRPQEIPSKSAVAVLHDPRADGALMGRLVFLGATAAGIGDRVVTAVSPGAPLPGVLVQAATAEAVLRRDLLRPVPLAVTMVLSALLSYLALDARVRKRRAGLLLAGFFALTPFPAAYFVLLVAHVALPAMALSVSSLAVVGGTELLVVRTIRRRAAVQAARIAELERVARELEGWRREEAEARRVVAHELKTPLTSVRGLAQLLEGFDLGEEERKRVAGMVVSEATRLAEMVEALLDLERLRLKDFGRSAVPLDLSVLVAARLEALRAGTAPALRAELTPGVAVVGDQALLARVVENLVANAVKFAPEGTPTTVRLARDGSRALLDVEDRGPGVPPELRELIFRRFERGGAPATVPGLGLGLALVAEVVAWHRGDVAVTDASGGGSRFRVRLPLAP